MNFPPSSMPQSPQPEEAPQAVHHVCFSGSLACSGCNPCVECLQHVRAGVLPAAMVAAGLNGATYDRLHNTMEALQSACQALQARGVDPTQFGIAPSLFAPVPTAEEQAAAFFQGFIAGWRRLHDAMRQDPELQARMHMTDVTALALLQMRQMVPGPGRGQREEQVSRSAGQSEREREESPQPNPGGGHATAQAALAAQRSREELTRLKNIVQPINAEDLSAAAAPVPENETPKGVVIGSVMNVPPSSSKDLTKNGA